MTGRGILHYEILQNIAKTRQLAPDNREVLYKSAIALELTGKRREVWKAMDELVKGKYSLREIRHEPDLRALRQAYLGPASGK